MILQWCSAHLVASIQCAIISRHYMQLSHMRSAGKKNFRSAKTSIMIIRIDRPGRVEKYATKLRCKKIISQTRRTHLRGINKQPRRLNQDICTYISSRFDILYAADKNWILAGVMISVVGLRRALHTHPSCNIVTSVRIQDSVQLSSGSCFLHAATTTTTKSRTTEKNIGV